MAETKFGEIEVRDGIEIGKREDCEFYQVIAEIGDWMICVDLQNGTLFAYPKGKENRND